MANFDDDGLFAESSVLGSQSVEKSVIEGLPFYCRHCEQWGVVHDDEVFNRHAEHDVDIVSPVHLRNGDRLVLRANYVNVDRKETQDRGLIE